MERFLCHFGVTTKIGQLKLRGHCNVKLLLLTHAIVIACVGPVYAAETSLMNAEERQVAANLWTKPLSLNHWSSSYCVYIHRHHLLLRSSKSYPHFTVPWKVEG